MPLRPRDSTTRTARTSEDADRGLVASLEPAVVTSNGRVVWDNDAWRFLEAPCPPTANPSFWRQGQLCSRQGPFQVTDGIYQVRGLDLSNMTLIEGERGVIVVDPLISVETASAALDLYRRHRGDRPARRERGRGMRVHPTADGRPPTAYRPHDASSNVASSPLWSLM